MYLPPSCSLPKNGVVSRDQIRSPKRICFGYVRQPYDGVTIAVGNAGCAEDVAAANDPALFSDEAGCMCQGGDEGLLSNTNPTQVFSQTVSFDSSCTGQPLRIGDEFGMFELVGFQDSNGRNDVACGTCPSDPKRNEVCVGPRFDTIGFFPDQNICGIETDVSTQTQCAEPTTTTTATTTTCTTTTTTTTSTTTTTTTATTTTSTTVCPHIPPSRRTCQELGWHPNSYAGWTYEDRCAKSVFGGDCSLGAMFGQAEQLCSAQGARLCTPHELAGDVARLTGCELDKSQVWSIKQCKNDLGDDGHMVVGGSSKAPQAPVCAADAEATEAHGVRCCAENADAAPQNACFNPERNSTSSTTTRVVHTTTRLARVRRHGPRRSMNERMRRNSVESCSCGPQLGAEFALENRRLTYCSHYWHTCAVTVFANRRDMPELQQSVNITLEEAFAALGANVDDPACKASLQVPDGNVNNPGFKPILKKECYSNASLWRHSDLHTPEFKESLTITSTATTTTLSTTSSSTSTSTTTTID